VTPAGFQGRERLDEQERERRRGTAMSEKLSDGRLVHSRRQFVQWVGSALAMGARLTTPALAQRKITATEVVERIKSKLAAEGVVWRPSYFDGFHLGDPEIAVQGIAVTFEPTLDVLHRASMRGKNLVICHESTFWDGFDPPQLMVNDPVHKLKIRFAQQNNMAVWRIHDHWHRRRPDPIFMGLAHQLEWGDFYDLTTQPHHFNLPEMPLEAVARHVQLKLESQNVVVVGEPDLPVRTVGDSIHVLATVLPALHSCDVALVGETPEHDSFEYVRDALALGEKKGLIMISHERLEEWGMRDFVPWVEPLVPDVPLEWISTGDAFQVPVIST
jgi:putative NIF3 family GTP cyclohydrolase 1 type 2